MRNRMDPNDCLLPLRLFNRSTGKPSEGFILMDRMDPNGWELISTASSGGRVWGNLAAAASYARLLLHLFQLSVSGQLWLLLLLTLLLPTWIGH